MPYRQTEILCMSMRRNCRGNSILFSLRGFHWNLAALCSCITPTSPTIWMIGEHLYEPLLSVGQRFETTLYCGCRWSFLVILLRHRTVVGYCGRPSSGRRETIISGGWPGRTPMVLRYVGCRTGGSGPGSGNSRDTLDRAGTGADRCRDRGVGSIRKLRISAGAGTTYSIFSWERFCSLKVT